jgi:hypothetical protein
MKFQTKIILLITACLFSHSLCQRGLFEAVAQDMDNSMQNGSGKKSSLFDDIKPRKDNKLSKQRVLPTQPSGSLFESVGLNFNQVSEKIQVKNNKNVSNKNKSTNQMSGSLFSAFTDKNKEKNELNEKSIFSSAIRKIGSKKSEIKNVVPGAAVQKKTSNINNNISKNKDTVISQPQQKNNDLANEIKQLRYKTAILMELNSKLSKKVNKKRRLNRKNKRVSRNIVSFIQKHDGAVTKIKTKIENKQNSIKTELSNKEAQFNSLYQEANSNFSSLQAKLGDLSKLFEGVMNKENSQLNSLNEKLNLNEMKIKDKLDVGHNVIVDGKVISKNIDLASFRGDGDSLIFENEKTKLIIGNKIIHSRDLLKNLQLIQKFNNKCGDDLKQCKILTREDLIKRAMNHGKILEDLKGLRAQLERLSESGKLN